MRNGLLPAVLLSLAILAGTASAAQDHRPGGWLWYHDPAPPVATPHRPAARPSSPPPQQTTWTTKWIRQTLPRLRDLAVEDPSPTNVRAYLLLQRVAIDRAQRFAEVTTMVTQGNPSLDENSRFPLATTASQAQVSRTQEALTRAVAEIAKSSGLFFFFSSRSAYAIQDLPVVRTLELSTGMKILPVSVDGRGIDSSLFPNFVTDHGQAARLGVQTLPAFFLVRPPNMVDVVPIGQGYLALDELEKRLVDEAYYRGWIGKALYDPTRIAAPMYVAGQSASQQSEIAPGDVSVIEAALSHLRSTPAPAAPAGSE